MGKVKAQANSRADTAVFVEIPRGECPSGYATTVVNVTSLTDRQANTLKMLTCELRARNERFSSRDAVTSQGIVVDRPVHAFKWLLDRIADAIDDAR